MCLGKWLISVFLKDNGYIDITSFKIFILCLELHKFLSTIKSYICGGNIDSEYLHYSVFDL
jgi:hypothetical protein